MGWLAATWGKFRCWERTQASRLSREQLQGAHVQFDGLLKLESEKKTHDEVKAVLKASYAGLSSDNMVGVKIFSAWMRENKDRLEQIGQVRIVSDGASATDSISVQLIS